MSDANFVHALTTQMRTIARQSFFLAESILCREVLSTATSVASFLRKMGERELTDVAKENTRNAIHAYNRAVAAVEPALENLLAKDFPTNELPDEARIESQLEELREAHPELALGHEYLSYGVTFDCPELVMEDEENPGIQPVTVGPFRVTLALDTGSVQVDRITTSAPKSISKYCHPHVSCSGELCQGAWKDQIEAACRSCEWLAAANMVLSLLSNYDGPQAYCRLEHWNESEEDDWECPYCGADGEQELVCQECSEVICSNCYCYDEENERYLCTSCWERLENEDGEAQPAVTNLSPFTIGITPLEAASAS